uniref:ShKT domain-containing protein n=1 Tax=Ditylenchus dipsaci TaxID=166011 RepID=A0A915E8U5_9BILA
MKESIAFFIFKLVLWFNNWRSISAQLAICPNGFVFGGLCGLSGGAGLNGACPLTIPPFHCIRGSCCRDQRPLIQRLLVPTFYPNVFGNNNNGIGIGIGNNIPIINTRINVCIDRAVNCNRLVFNAYTTCMVRNCARTCGVCHSTVIGGLGSLGVGNLGGLGIGGLGAINGGRNGLG